MILGASRYLLEELLCNYVGGIIKPWKLVLFFGTLLVYLFGAFTEFQFDPDKWDKITRLFISFLELIVVFSSITIERG